MRSIKRITVFLLAAVMTVGMCMTAFAAPAGISEGEEKLLNEAVAHAKALGVDTDASAAFKSAYSQAEAFLVVNGLNDGQIQALSNAMSAAATDAKTQMNQYGVAKLADLKNVEGFDYSAYQAATVQTLAKKATDVGITVKVDANGKIFADIPDKSSSSSDNGGSGSSISTDSVIKQTGLNLNATAAVMILLVAGVVLCGVYAKKRDLLNGEA
ncbi:hypothetical protein [Diplocloster hominis]|uniref:hypothetical protein n=1 Tax=Diplocloster hominis TaxID=3079010 RepID=UPI0031BA0AA6